MNFIIQFINTMPSQKNITSSRIERQNLSELQTHRRADTDSFNSKISAVG